MKIYPEYVAKDRVMQPGQEGSAVTDDQRIPSGSSRIAPRFPLVTSAAYLLR